MVKQAMRQEVPAGALDRLKARRASLLPATARIGDFIICHAAEVVHMSVTEVAGAREGSVASLALADYDRAARVIGTSFDVLSTKRYVMT